jgi:hypothetical protein
MWFHRARANRGVSVVDDVVYPPTPMLASGLWEISRGLADLGLLVLFIVVLLMAVTGQFELSDSLAAVIPVSVRAYFTSEQMKPTPWVQPVEPKPAQAVARSLSRHVATATRPAPAHFGLGSTKAEVRAVQGPPTEVGDNVWSYGRSRVYFVQDRVAGWQSDPGRPLRLR